MTPSFNSNSQCRQSSAPREFFLSASRKQTALGWHADPGADPPGLRASELRQLLVRIAEPVEVQVHLVHHGEIESAHLAAGFVPVVEDAAPLDPAPPAAEQDHGKLRRVVAAG